MSRTFLTAILAGSVTFCATISQAQQQDSTSIEGVIGAQIDAFRVDDFAKAFEFASPAIQGIFGTAERFGQMVRQGYPMVWRPADVNYLELRDNGGDMWQKVMIRDGSGALHMLDYQMVRTQSGWQINGVRLLEAPELGA